MRLTHIRKISVSIQAMTQCTAGIPGQCGMPNEHCTMPETTISTYLEVHDGIKELEDGIENVGVEGTFVVSTLNCGPLFSLLVKEVLTPQPVIYCANCKTKMSKQARYTTAC